MGVIIDREIKVSCELTTALRTRWKGCRCFPHGCYTKTYGSLPWCTAHTLASSPAWQGNVAVSFAQRARPWLRTWGMPSAADDRVVWPEWSWGHRKDNAKLVLYIKSSWLICYIAWEQKSTFPGGALANIGKGRGVLECCRRDWTVQSVPCLTAPASARSWTWQASLTSVG